MNKGTRFAGFELIHLLVLVAAAELAFNRLATQELRPEGDLPLPWWYQIVDHIGLFTQYFAATLALGIIGYQLWRIMDQRLYPTAARFPLLVAGWVFLALGAVALVISLSADIGFAFETAFMLMALILLGSQLRRGGDMGVKIGLLLLITPLAVHYYGVFAIRLEGEAALWSGLPEQVLQYGQWTLIVAALLSPYCFAPRPLLHSLVKPAPIILATFISVLGVVLLRQFYVVAMRLAENWLGLDIGPGAPLTSLFTYALAVGTMTWTLAACFSADAVARRDIGVGIALVVLSGYGFTWPVQFLVSMVGLMTIADAVSKVAEEEASLNNRREFFAPPIAESVWRDYIQALTREASRISRSEDTPGEDAADGTHATDNVTVLFVTGDDTEHQVTHLVTRSDAPESSIRVRIERYHESIVAIDIGCGHVPDPEVEPAWTLFARPEKLLGVGSHPEPPHTAAPLHRVPDDPAFEHRFRVRDAGGYTDALMDHTLRARACALIDGWLAYWPGVGIRYRVHPGRGAPLDHPIPITEMAFRGSVTPSSATRLASVIELLSTMTRRGLGE